MLFDCFYLLVEALKLIFSNFIVHNTSTKTVISMFYMTQFVFINMLLLFAVNNLNK